MNDLFTNYQGRNNFSLGNDDESNRQEICQLETTLNELDRARMSIMKSSNRLYIKDQLRNLKKDVILSFMCNQTAEYIKDRQKFKRFWDKNEQLCVWLMSIQKQFRKTIIAPEYNRNITVLQRPKPDQSTNRLIIKRNPKVIKQMVDGQPAFGKKPMAKQTNPWIKQSGSLSPIKEPFQILCNY